MSGSIQRAALAWLVVLWSVPRVVLLGSFDSALAIALVFDAAFVTCLLVAFVWPVMRSGQLRQQAGIVAKLCLLGVSHGVFYWAVLDGNWQWCDRRVLMSPRHEEGQG